MHANYLLQTGSILLFKICGRVAVHSTVLASMVLQCVKGLPTEDKSSKDHPAKSMIGPEFILDGFTGSLARTNHKKNHWQGEPAEPSQPVRPAINW
jgi:hypothetical protein